MTQIIQQTFTPQDLMNSRFGLPNPYLRNDPNIHKNHRASILTKYGNDIFMNYAMFGLNGFSSTNNNNQFKPFSAKIETISQKPTWLSKINKYHCLIPVSGFYKWKKHYNNIPYLHYMKKNKLMYIAGFYHREIIEDTYYNYSFAILTKPDGISNNTRFNRLPLVLDENNAEKWLDNQFSQTMVANSNNMVLSKKRVSRIINQPDIKDIDEIYYVG